MNVLVVIVNYRTASLVVDCLASLKPEVESRDCTKVIVVDNASPDDSASLISAAVKDMDYSGWCKFVAAPENGGFSYGNDFALAAFFEGGDSRYAPPPEIRKEFLSLFGGAKPDLVWLLNPDTIVHQHALRKLIDFMSKHPRAGIAGGRAENADGSVRCSAFRFHSPLGELASAVKYGPITRYLVARHVIALPIRNEPFRADWVSGASMMVRREVFETAGLLDPRYFMYYEETDFCLRAHKAGFECWYVPQSRIVHLVGQSSGVTGAKARQKRRPKYWFDSRRYYFVKNHGEKAFHLANLLWLAGYPFGWLADRIKGRTNDDPPLLWWDFLRYNYFQRG